MANWMIAALPVLLFAVACVVPLLIAAHYVSKPRPSRRSGEVE